MTEKRPISASEKGASIGLTIIIALNTGCLRRTKDIGQLLTESVVPVEVSPEASPTSLSAEVAEVVAPTVTPESAVGFIPPNNPPEYDAEFFGGGRIIPEDNEGLNELLQAGRYRSLYLMASDMGVSLDLSSLEALQGDLDNFEARGDIESVQVWNGDELAPTVLSVVERTNGDGSKTFPWLGDPENNLLSARPDLAPVEDYLIGDVTIQPGYDFQWVYNEADEHFYTYMIDGEGRPASWFDATRAWTDEDNQVVDGWYFVEIGFDGIGIPQKDMKVVFNGSELVVLDKDENELGTVEEMASKNQLPEGVQAVVNKHGLIVTKSPEGQTLLTSPDHPEWPIFIQEDGEWRQTMIFQEDINGGELNLLKTASGELVPSFSRMYEGKGDTAGLGPSLYFNPIVADEPFMGEDGAWYLPVAVSLSKVPLTESDLGPLLPFNLRLGPPSYLAHAGNCNSNQYDEKTAMWTGSMTSIQSIIGRLQPGDQIFVKATTEYWSPEDAELYYARVESRYYPTVRDSINWLGSEENGGAELAKAMEEGTFVDTKELGFGATRDIGICEPW